MRKFTLFFLLIFTCTLHAQVKTIRGQLATKDGKPLSKTSFHVKNRNITGKTDRKGFFILKNVTDDDVIITEDHKMFKVPDVTKSVLSVIEAPAVSPLLISSTDTVGVKFLTGDEKTVDYRGTLDGITAIRKNKSGYTVEQGQKFLSFSGCEINLISFVEAASIGRLPELQSQYAQNQAGDFFRTGISFGNRLGLKFRTFNKSTTSVSLGQRKNNSPIPGAYNENYNASLGIEEVKIGKRFTSSGAISYNSSYERMMQQGGNLSSLLASVLTAPETADRTSLPDRNKNDNLTVYANTKYAHQGAKASLSLGFDRQWNEMHNKAFYPSFHSTSRKEEITNMIAEAYFSYFIRCNSETNITIVPLSYGFKRTVDNINRYDSNLFQSNILTDNSLSRNAHDLKYSVLMEYANTWILKLENTHYFSNTLSSSSYANLFPGVGVKLRIDQLFLRHWYDDFFDDWSIRQLALRGTIKKSIGESSLVYRNFAALSTSINAADFRSYYEYTDLFSNDNLVAETYLKRGIGLDCGFFNNRIFIVVDYFNNTTKNFIAPVLSAGEGNFLQNIGAIRNSGYDASVNCVFHSNRNSSVDVAFTFSRVKSRVTDVYNDHSVVPLAGFSDIATVFAENEPLGAIYGTTYRRDEQGEIATGADGLPLVNEQLTKIGDPTPDFRMSLVPEFAWRNYGLSCTMEYSHGGQRWNGTRAYLDYLETTGIDGLGASAGEDYIENATCFRLSDVTLSYRLPQKYCKFFRALHLNLHARNLLVISPYKGVDPSSLLFGYLAGNGLDLFNLPSSRSYSFTATINF